MPLDVEGRYSLYIAHEAGGRLCSAATWQASGAGHIPCLDEFAHEILVALRMLRLVRCVWPPGMQDTAAAIAMHAIVCVRL